MKNRDHIKLDVLSNIDEPIIDEVTDTRISLSHKLQIAAKKARFRFITIGSIAASLLLIGALFFIIRSQMPGSVSEPVIPVYQGMTIRKQSTSLTLPKPSYNRVSVLSLSSSAHSAQKDDHKKPHEELKEDIRDITDIEVVSDDEVKYYVTPEETFVIEVHISNPEDYEIQSFTLNGKKYANYMFKEGSTMEVLLLEVTAPATSGYVEYTIDAIKYIDGTEIKDVDMSSGDKSIKTGVAYPAGPSAEVTSQTVSSTSLELTIHISDPYDLIGNNELAVYLSDGEAIVDKQALRVGDNTVTFENLIMSKTYEYGIITVYDLVDGRETHAEWLLIDQMTTLAAYAVDNIVLSKDSISFDISGIGEVGEITAISLYDAITNELVEVIGADGRAFERLLSNHAYNLYVDFTYTVDDTEIQDWVAVKGIVTPAKEVPVLTFGEVSSDQTSVSYTVHVTDPDGILTIDRVELLKEAEVVCENGTALEGKFEGLLSDNTYIVKVTYTYDLGDGQENITDSVTQKITTKSKTKPTITFADMEVTDTRVNGIIHMKDEDSVGAIIAVDLYESGEKVQGNAQKELNFSDLTHYTAYQVLVTYSYDLNDGVGTQTDTAVYDFKTAPYLAFNDFTVVNTSAVGEGETIFLRVNITNPDRVVYRKIVVNGKTYDVVESASTSTMLICNIVSNGQFEGGNTTLTIEKVIAEIDGKQYTIEPQANNTAEVFIIGKLEVEGIDIVILEEGQNVERTYAFPDDTVYLRLTLNNKTGYHIDSVTLNSIKCTELIKVDDEHYMLDVSGELFGGASTFSLTELQYSREDFQDTLTTKTSSRPIYRLSDHEIHYVSTAEDLLNMYSGKYYEQTNDIDLSGIEWKGELFNGVFNGNGYSIKNMTNVGTVMAGESIGLFSRAIGVIENVHLESVMFLLTVDSTSTGSTNVQIGGIAGEGGTLYINNCSIDEESVISVQSRDSASLHVIYIAGMAVKATMISNCVNSASLTVNSGSPDMFGIVAGFAVCNATGAAEATSLTITNCIMNGDINMSVTNGSGHGIAECGTIINCINNGTGTGGTINGISGGITGVVSIVTNCYALGENATAERLSSKEFYTEVLGFDETIWNLDDLDIENGKYPTLK